MTRKQKRQTIAMVPPEKKEAIWLLEWVHSQPIHLIREVILHIANEGKRSFVTAKLLKRMGLRKGVSDYFLPIPMWEKRLAGLWIELKPVKGGKLTAEQKCWLEKMQSLGYAAYEAKGWVDAKNIILSYLSTP